ncbi:hypothetical protein EC991_005049 [Linnemannia zychae]|nr:hypothetical protein EC991_005049 [Linnemannia zychae]
MTTAPKMSLSSVIARHRVRMVHNHWVGERVNMSTTAANHNAVEAWDVSDSCKIIIIKGSGDKAFCAGGDIREVFEMLKSGKKHEASDFAAEEYKLNHMIATLKTPFVAILNGVTMGGGVGLSVHAPFRIATENTLFAMPETNIGVFPDVGGSFFLPRLDGETGTYLGLSGARLRGIDTVYAGIATHYVSSDRLDALEDRLSKLETDDFDVINMTIEEFVSGPSHDHKYSLSEHRNAIDRCFRFNTVEEIITALEKENTTFAEKTLKTLHIMSPTSLKVLFEHDFYEGVRALLIEKSLQPKWNPATIEEVDRERILGLFFRDQTPNALTLSSSTSWMKYPYSHYGLPSEDEIQMVIASEIQDSGLLKLPAEEVAEICAKKISGKIGVKEKVMEVLSRTVM